MLKLSLPCLTMGNWRFNMPLNLSSRAWAYFRSFPKPGLPVGVLTENSGNGFLYGEIRVAPRLPRLCFLAGLVLASATEIVCVIFCFLSFCFSFLLFDFCFLICPFCFDFASCCLLVVFCCCLCVCFRFVAFLLLAAALTFCFLLALPFSYLGSALGSLV